MKRLIAELGPETQKVLLFVGGLHGNEPAGVQAIEEQMEEWAHRAEGVPCKMIGIRGNVAALHKKKRFLSQDLNRMWLNCTPFDPPKERSLDDETKEFQELNHFFAALMKRHHQLFLLDLHTTSAPSIPFGLPSSEQEASLPWPQCPVPLVLGALSAIRGTLTQAISRWGHLGLAVEGGQHQDSHSVSCLRQMMVFFAHQFGGLPRTTKALPPPQPLYDLVYRHAISPKDRFQMKPGFRNFDPVLQGQVLGHDGSGPVLAPITGLVFMPLYQGLGEDGFFIVQERS